jgi:hypothetical protein
MQADLKRHATVNDFAGSFHNQQDVLNLQTVPSNLKQALQAGS